MKTTVKILSLIFALCLCFGMVACGSDSDSDKDSSSKQDDTKSVVASADGASSTITAPEPDIDIETTTSVTYALTTDEGVKDTIKVTCNGDKIFGITETVEIDSSELSEDEIELYDSMFDEIFKELDGEDFVHYTRTNSQGVYTIVVAFTDLDVRENAEILNIHDIYAGYSFSTTIEEFEQELVAEGYSKIK